jgi:hypothetical protein
VVRIAKAIHLELYELFRFKRPTSEKELVLEKLERFASRLTTSEVALLLDIGAAVIRIVRSETFPDRQVSLPGDTPAKGPW